MRKKKKEKKVIQIEKSFSSSKKPGLSLIWMQCYLMCSFNFSHITPKSIITFRHFLTAQCQISANFNISVQHSHSNWTLRILQWACRNSLFHTCCTCSTLVAKKIATQSLYKRVSDDAICGQERVRAGKSGLTYK